MAKNKKFYVTTPIYYPNDIPHLGHAYTTIAGDILARWHKLLGEDVYYLTGTDEHGKKLEEAAAAKGKKPKEFIDELIPEFKKAWKLLNIDYDYFIRTTDKDHEKNVQEILQKTFENGDIYLGEYEGLYCVGCEAYYTEKDLEDGNLCPIHKKPVEKLKEESYFFKLSKYQKKLLDYYKKNPNFILPKTRANEIINRVKEGLQDFSVSRTSFDWGIKLPFDKKHIAYVWYDALLNYYSGTRIKGKEKYWPADCQLIGKDILWFHTVYWPAMLMSVGLKLPKTVFAHGWWTFDKEKISKSRGKIINIQELIDIAGVDSARYFLFRENPFGDDGDFSEQGVIDRHNNELADKLGNLISRVTTLVETKGLEKCENKLLKKLKLKEIENKFKSFEIDKALELIFGFIDSCNEYIQSKKPWTTGDKKVLYELVDSIKAIAILLWPFIPETSEKIAKNLGIKIGFNEIKKPYKVKKIQKSEILFKKVQLSLEKKVLRVKETKRAGKEKEEKKEKEGKVKGVKKGKDKEVEGVVTMGNIKYDDFAKLELKVGSIKKIEDISGADKLFKLEVDTGEKSKENRIIVAGIKEHYSKAELKGKQIVVICNLEPRELKGIKSNGMLLAAVSDDHKSVVLIGPEKKVDSGVKIS